MTRWALGLVLGALLAPRALPAQRAATPEQVMRDFLAANAAGRWREAAALIDLEAYARWRRDNLAVARRSGGPRRVTAEQIMRADTLMPREVAEYQARRAAERAAEDSLPWLLREHAGVPTLDSLERLPAREAAARWLQAQDPRWMADVELARLRRSGCRFDSVGVVMARDAIRPDGHLVMGAIVRDTMAFVVTQQVLRHPGEYGREPDDRLLTPRAVRLRRTAAGWRVLDWNEWFTASGVFDVAAGCER
ncbi:MAG TPA: hypothetical protein VEA99_03815 [Gemmatimonadaceae bacterium]|nr:hypothetical protein [Gemmatimonadaceae bacterium]